MSKLNDAVSWMEGIARDNKHGYDQGHRWGTPDYDCSTLVYKGFEHAGFNVPKSGTRYTGTIKEHFGKIGFKDVIKKVNINTGSGLKRGDILLKDGHVEVYCGNGKRVGAHSNEKGKARGGKPGDQTGNEISIKAYRNNGWKHVLRYEEKAPSGGGKAVKQVAKVASKPVVKGSSYYKKYTGKSVKIDEVFKAIGAPYGDWKKRKPVATKNSIKNYTGTASQNTKLIEYAKKGVLRK